MDGMYNTMCTANVKGKQFGRKMQLNRTQREPDNRLE